MVLIQTILLLAAGAAGGEDRLIAQPGLTAQLGCLETEFSRSAERRDRDAFAAFLDPDVRFVTGRSLRGPAAVLEDWASLLSAGGPEIRWRPELVEVAASGDLALTRGPYRVRSTNADGETVESWGTFTSMWRKGADGWRVLFDAGADRGMQPSEAQRALLESEPECEALADD